MIMSNILITGAFGNLGSMLCNELAASNHNVYCLDIKHPTNDIKPHITNYFIYDIRKNVNYIGCVYSLYDVSYRKFLKSYYNLEDYLLDFDIEYVVHCASPNNPSMSFKYRDTYKETIVDGTENLLNAITYVNKAYIRDIKFVYISSSAVYEKVKITPFKEEHIHNSMLVNSTKQTHMVPDNPYGEFKLTAEGIVYKSPVSSIILRCFDMFSDSFNPNTPYSFSMINKFVYLAFMQKINMIQKEKYKLYVDGHATQSRTYMYMKNVTALIKDMIENETIAWNKDVYNVCSDMTDLISLKEVIQLLERELQIQLVVEYNEQFRKEDVHIIYGDNTKVKDKLGFQYQYPFQTSFKQLLNKMNNHIMLSNGGAKDGKTHGGKS